MVVSRNAAVLLGRVGGIVAAKTRCCQSRGCYVSDRPAGGASGRVYSTGRARCAVISLSVGGLLAIVACASPPEVLDRTREPVAIRLPAAPYYGVSWIGSDNIATAVSAGEDEVILVATADGGQIERVELPRVEECVRRVPVGLTRLPTSELGFVARCVNATGYQPAPFLAYDRTTGSFRDLGIGLEWPAAMTWTPDMDTVVYTAEGSLCSTLYQRTPTSHGPMALDVEIGGRTVPLGEDLSQAEDGCTHRGNADWPAFSPDGSALAVLAAPVRSGSGQARIDQPWTLVVVANGQPAALLGGIHYPRGLGWLSPSELIFTGRVGGEDGLWVIGRDDGTLTKVGEIALAWIAVDDDHRVLGVLEDPRLDRGIERLENTIVAYDLSDLR